MFQPLCEWLWAVGGTRAGVGSTELLSTAGGLSDPAAKRFMRELGQT